MVPYANCSPIYLPILLIFWGLKDRIYCFVKINNLIDMLLCLIVISIWNVPQEENIVACLPEGSTITDAKRTE